MSIWVYVCGHLLSLFALWGFFVGGLTSYLLPFVTFGIIPVFELLTPPNFNNFDQETLQGRDKSRAFHLLVLSVVPLQYVVLSLYLWCVAQGEWSVFEWAGNTLSMGILCGSYGINVAHELGHRSDKLSRWGAKALLLTSLYMHFFIEHNRGHHAKVATEDDPASARKGETVYTFWRRSVVGSFISAWRLEARRLKRKSLSEWSWTNEALRFAIIEVSAIAIITLFAGPWVAFSFIAAAVVGFSLLEAVNYIEHYGLQRKKRTNGRYEPVTPAHSWNADYPVSRSILFELSRHADHHAHPRRAYAALRHFPESFQLPTGYPGMILLSLFPPLYFSIMDRQLEREALRVAHLSSLPEDVSHA